MSLLQEKLTVFSKYFQNFLENEIASYIRKECGNLGASLSEAILYSLLSGGKRLRPFLVFLFSASCFEKPDEKNLNVYYLAAVIEAMHTYSLIHDDLPAMDNDDMRRGQPSSHKKYSEWLAILSGDALQTLSFDFLRIANFYSKKNKQPWNLDDALKILIDGTGVAGMLLGQTLDIENEEKLKKMSSEEKTSKQFQRDRELIHEIHTRKTASLIVSACQLGAMCMKVGGGAYLENEGYIEDENHQKIKMSDIKAYALKLGLLFQIQDDLLDIRGDASLVGKTLSKDTCKLTYHSVYGLDATEKYAQTLVKELEILAQEFIGKNKMYQNEYGDIMFALPYYAYNRKF